MLVIPAFGRWREEDGEPEVVYYFYRKFEANLDPKNRNEQNKMYLAHHIVGAIRMFTYNFVEDILNVVCAILDHTIWII